MEYLDSIGELILIFVLLLFLVGINKTNQFPTRFRNYLTAALLFIIVTASFGAVRFAGFTQVSALHDLLSYLSTHFAMIIYVFSLPFVLLSAQKESVGRRERRGSLDNNKVLRFARYTLLLTLLINAAIFYFNLQFLTLFTDIMLVIGFVLFMLVTRAKRLLSGAVLFLILVPATQLIGVNEDLTMAIFHILLATHFALIHRIFSNQNINRTNAQEYV